TKSLPVDPADIVVLAVGVVVAVLRIADLVAGENERHAQRQHQAGKLISTKPLAQRDDGWIIARPLMAAIITVIVIGAVAVVLAVGLVVLLVVAEQVGKGEAVMDCDVIDAGMRGAAVMVEQVGGGSHTARHLADETAFAAPIASHRAAITVVPFRPLGRKR